MPEQTALEALDAALAPIVTGDADGATTNDETTDGDGEVHPKTGEEGREETVSDDAGGDIGDGDGDAGTGDVPGAEGNKEPPAAAPEIDPKTGKPVEKGPNGERERNPDGTWKKNEPKKPDAINDPIPTNVKKDTQDRIRTLIDTTKTVTAERDELKQNFDYMVNGIQATGASPEQYGELLSWTALFNSGVPAQQEKALELAESVCERLATLLGKERTVGDPLKVHADLQEAVRTGKLTAEYAKEIARTRNGQTFRTELTTSAQQRQQQADQAKGVEAQARADLTALEGNLRATDSDYESIKAAIVPVLKPIMAAINPAQWQEKFTAAYKAEKSRRASIAATAQPRVPANQPMRAGKQPAGGQTRAPANALEALNGALSGMK